MANINDNNNAENNTTEATKNKKGGNRRRKISIETITITNRKHVTFSKRRVGLFKKASELCALCGVEMTILTFSERGKLFCFGHPDPDAVIHRYLMNGSHYSLEANEYRNNNGFTFMLDEHNKQYEEIKRRIDEEESKKLCEIDEIKKEKNGGFWWDEASVDDMELDDLEQFMACLVELQINVANRVDQLTGSSLLFMSGQMGNSFVGPGINNTSGLKCLDNGQTSNDQLSIDMMMFDDTTVDVSHNFNCRLMNEVHMTHFTEQSQGIELLDFVGMNYPNPSFIPQQAFEFGTGI